MENWKFASLIEVDKEYRVDGLNIWNFYWHCANRKVEVVCPFEGNNYFFKEYTIQTPEKSISFLAGEFSNQKIGLYIKEDNLNNTFNNSNTIS